jgi:hypothetical protein
MSRKTDNYMSEDKAGGQLNPGGFSQVAENSGKTEAAIQTCNPAIEGARPFRFWKGWLSSDNRVGHPFPLFSSKGAHYAPSINDIAIYGMQHEPY